MAENIRDRYGSSRGPTKNGLRIAHWNMQSLGLGKGCGRSKFNAARCMVLRSNFHLFALSETWLTEKVPEHRHRIADYACERSNRLNGRAAGGIIVYIHDSLQYTRITAAEGGSNIQIMVLRVTRPFLVDVVIIYNPPTSDSSHVIDFTLVLASIFAFRHRPAVPVPIVLLGDININLFDREKYTNISINQMDSALQRVQIEQIVTRITRLDSDALLDHIYIDTTSLLRIIECDVIRHTKSDHDIIFCVVARIRNGNRARVRGLGDMAARYAQLCQRYTSRKVHERTARKDIRAGEAKANKAFATASAKLTLLEWLQDFNVEE